MNSKFHARLRDARQEAAAFTVKELLVVIAVLALLCSLAIPAFARVKPLTAIAQCADNVRRITLAFHMFANENNDRLPQSFHAGVGPWHVQSLVPSALVGSRLERKHYYCPANTDYFDGNFNSAGIGGYAWSMAGTTTVKAEDQNATLTPQPRAISNVRLPPTNASQRVLVADVTICAPVANPSQANATTYNWTTTPGYSAKPFRTTHMNTRTNLPLGGNAGMLDGHVEFRPFQQMLPRTTNGPPVFWW